MSGGVSSAFVIAMLEAGVPMDAIKASMDRLASPDVSVVAHIREMIAAGVPESAALSAAEKIEGDLLSMRGRYVSRGAPYERPQLQPASVYVFQDYDDGLVKVGVSQHPHYRCATLAKERGCRSLNIEHITERYERSVAFSIERRAHEILSASRIEGEWFRCSPQEAVAAISAATDEIDP